MCGSRLNKLLAWGQYLHWCELQFVEYCTTSELSSASHVVGVTAHWLAALHVVLEGWKKLQYKDDKIAKLLSLYPENEAVLRRCRNAVYHFQAEILDERIGALLSDANEAFAWSLALHFEFQRFLVDFPHGVSPSREENKMLASEMALCIGWWPDCSHRAHVLRVYDRIQNLVSTVDTQEVRELAESMKRELAAIDTEPFTSMLSRYHVDEL